MTPRLTHKLHLHVREGFLDPEKDNIDFELVFDNGDRFFGTFLTLENIRHLMLSYSDTGECCHGKYFCTLGMIIVESLHVECLEAVANELVATEEFRWALSRIEEE